MEIPDGVSSIEEGCFCASELLRSVNIPLSVSSLSSFVFRECPNLVLVVDKDTFVTNEDAVKYILKDIAKDYLFDDVGFSLKNYCNWGSRFTTTGDEMVILDYGYLYPLLGQNREELFRCPRCGSKLSWNPNFTEFVCSGDNGHERCSAHFSPTAIRHGMKMDFENLENKILMDLNSMEMPDLNTIEKTVK